MIETGNETIFETETESVSLKYWSLFDQNVLSNPTQYFTEPPPPSAIIRPISELGDLDYQPSLIYMWSRQKNSFWNFGIDRISKIRRQINLNGQVSLFQYIPALPVKYERGNII